MQSRFQLALTSLVGLVAVIIGVVFFSPIPKRLGLYRWYADHYFATDKLVGLTPAQHYGKPWNYTYEELYGSDLTGQRALVTGANSGIGYEMALAFARLGADVTLGCRNNAKCEGAAERMRVDERVKGRIETGTIDTSSLRSVKAFAENYKQTHEGMALDILVFNAGSAFKDKTLKCVPLSEDGIEKVFAANYVGHHLLYRLLEPMLEVSKMARIVQSSSGSSFMTYSYIMATDLETLNGCSEPFEIPGRIGSIGNPSYGQSKLAQIMWTKALTRRLPSNSHIYANAFNPGMADTAIWDKGLAEGKYNKWIRRFVDWFRSESMWTAEEGALSGMYLAVAKDRLSADNIRGKYFHPQAQEVVNPFSLDEDLQDRLWAFSDELVKDFLPVEEEVRGEEEARSD